MSRILVVYETFDGHSALIAERIAASLGQFGHEVDVRRAVDSGAASRIGACDAVIVGGPVRFGRHAPALEKFVTANARALARLPGAFFTVCMAAADPGAKRNAVATFGDKLLAAAGWAPQERAVFAGALQYRRYGFFMRLLMLAISAIAGGATDTSRDHVYTDWAAVDRFAGAFAARLEAQRAAA